MTAQDTIKTLCFCTTLQCKQNFYIRVHTHHCNRHCWG